MCRLCKQIYCVDTSPNQVPGNVRVLFNNVSMEVCSKTSANLINATCSWTKILLLLA